MRFGVCVGADPAAIAQAAQIGYDFVQCPISRLYAMSRGEFADFRRETAASGIKPEIGMNMLLAEHHVTGPEATLPQIREYLKAAFERGAQAGMDGVVFGAMGARNMPQGFTDRDMAYSQIDDFLQAAADEGEAYGIVTYVLPMTAGPKAANIITTIDEAAQIAARAGRANIACMADYYHMLNNGVDVDSIAVNSRWIRHMHIATPGRGYPAAGDGHDYTGFFNALKKARYDSRLGVEARPVDDFVSSAKASLELMKEMWHN